MGNKQTYAKTSTEVLKAAKWMLENVGWVKNIAVKYPAKYPSDGPIVPIGFCAAGAIESVQTDDNSSLQTEAYARLRAVLPNGRSIVSFNDDPATTKQDVLDAFDRAIKANKGSK